MTGSAPLTLDNEPFQGMIQGKKILKEDPS